MKYSIYDVLPEFFDCSFLDEEKFILEINVDKVHSNLWNYVIDSYRESFKLLPGVKPNKNIRRGFNKSIKNGLFKFCIKKEDNEIVYEYWSQLYILLRNFDDNIDVIQKHLNLLIVNILDN